MKKVLSLFLCLSSSVFGSLNSYTIENISFPDDMPPEVGGLAFDKQGNLYACLRRGDVVVTKPGKDPKVTKWKVFST